MRLLLDQGLPCRNAALLRAQGIDCVHTEEIGLAKASDQEILTHALNAQRTIITLDSDFHTLLASTGACMPSVVRLRVKGLSAENVAQLVLRVVVNLFQKLSDGIVASVDHRQHVRVRTLPLS